MIEIKHKHIQGYDFIQAFRKLANCPQLQFKNIYGVKKFTEDFEKEGKLSQEVRKSIIAKYSEKEDDGSIKESLDANGKKTGSASVPVDNQDLLNQEMANFMESPLVIQRNKLFLSEQEIAASGLSAIDLMILDCIAEIPEPKEDGAPTPLHAVSADQPVA